MAYKQKKSMIAGTDPVKRAKRLVRKNVGNTTVDSPDYDESKFDKSNRKIKKANKLLKKAGYSLEEREQATGAGGYEAAKKWSSKKCPKCGKLKSRCGCKY